MITWMITSSKVPGPRHLHMSVDVADGLPMNLQGGHPPHTRQVDNIQPSVFKIRRV